MVATTYLPDARRVDYRAKIAPLESDPGAWVMAVRGYCVRFFQRQNIRNMEMVNDDLSVIEKANHPASLDGFLLWCDDALDMAVRRKKNLDASVKPNPNRTYTTYHARIRKDSATQYVLCGSGYPFKVDLKTPEAVAKLRAFYPAIDEMRDGAVRDVPLESVVTQGGELIEIRPHTLPDEDKDLIVDLVSAIGVDTWGTIDDSIADAESLDSLHRRQWIGRDSASSRASVPVRYKVFPEAAREAGVIMSNLNTWVEYLKEMRKMYGLDEAPTSKSDYVTLSVIFNIPKGVDQTKFFADKSETQLTATWDAWWANYDRKFREKQTAEALKKVNDSALDEAFPRDEDNQPIGPDPDATIPKRGMNDPKVKPAPIEQAYLSDNTKFFIDFTSLCNKHKVPADKRNDLRHKAIGSSKQYKNDPDVVAWALATIEDVLIKEYPLGDPKEIIRDMFKSAGAPVDFEGATGFKTYDAAIKDGHTYAEIVEMVKTFISEWSAEDINQTPIAPNEQPGTTNDDAVEGVVVSETPKTAEIPANEAALKNVANDARAANKALATVDRNLVHYQPNPYWLTSPQWQLSPFDMAKFVADSRLFKNADTPAKALAIIFKGVEIGIGPMAALEHLNIIDGKPPSCDGALMLALLRKAGISVEFLERTDKICKLKMTRPDNGNSITQSFSFEEAQKAGLTNKGNWKYARAMLTWRAVSEAAKLIASDMMIMGGIPMYTHEEINPDAVLNEDGTLAA